MSKCIIFGGGDVFSPRKPGGDDLVIGADSGYVKAIELGFAPSAIIGDFDSSAVPDTKAHVIKLNRDKDDTDMLAAIKLGLRRGYKTFVIYGGVGGRLDHTAANFAALNYLNRFDAQGFLVDEFSIATVITDGTFTLPKTARGTASVLAYGGVCTGVTVTGMTYELKDAELLPDFPLGVSNAVGAGAKATVSVKNGSLLIFFPR